MSRYFILVVIAFIGLGYLSSCDNDDNVEIGFTGEEDEYALFDVDDNSVVGTVRFREREDGATSVVLLMNDVPAGNSHPAHIHANSAVEGGGINISLNPVSGDDDISTTLITQTDNGDPISYQELLLFDGHINVHQSADNMGTLIAQGDIGPNKLTGEAEFYKLFPVSNAENSPDSTIISFKERVNGETLVEMRFHGNTDVAHPAHIHSGTAAMGGPIDISLNDIDLTGRSATNVSQTDAGTSVTFNELTNYNGFINVHQSAGNMATLVSQGDIGANEFTGRSRSYDLKNVSGIKNGVATFYERKDETFLVALTLDAPENSSYPAHIHTNSVAEGGPIDISLNNVGNGLSLTEIDARDNDASITYEELLTFNGHINVHSEADMSVFVAQGDIGSNSPE